jgi:hypothetical protein
MLAGIIRSQVHICLYEYKSFILLIYACKNSNQAAAAAF